MRKPATDWKGRGGRADPLKGAAASGLRPRQEAPLDICDSARTAETYRLEKDDEACDDGIR